jgi:hypothetical protein
MLSSASDWLYNSYSAERFLPTFLFSFLDSHKMPASCSIKSTSRLAQRNSGVTNIQQKWSQKKTSGKISAMLAFPTFKTTFPHSPQPRSSLPLERTTSAGGCVSLRSNHGRSRRHGGERCGESVPPRSQPVGAPPPSPPVSCF